MAFTIADLHRTGRNVILRAPDIGILWAKLRHLARVNNDASGGVACVSENGTVTVHPTGYGARPDDEREFILAHELMHYLLSHIDRVKEVKGSNGLPLVSRDAKGEWGVDQPEEYKHWGISTDVVINETLKRIGFAVPPDACMMASNGKGYTGPLAAEPLYQHLLRDSKKGGGSGGGQGQPQQGSSGQPAPGRGCAPQGNEPSTQGQEAGKDANGSGSGAPKKTDAKGALGNLDNAKLDPGKEAAEAILALAGSGSAVADAIKGAKVKSLGWKDILKRGMHHAASSGARVNTTWAVLKRKTWRNGNDEDGRIVYPGKSPAAPAVAIIVDCSGSMNREDLSKVVTHTLEIMKTVNVRVYFVTHTDGVHWKGWVKPGDSAAIMKATACTGGTSFEEAYAAVDAAGKFDACIHFTDTLVGNWPPVKAKELTIALVGTDKVHRQPPRKRYNLMQVTNRN